MLRNYQLILLSATVFAVLYITTTMPVVVSLIIAVILFLILAAIGAFCIRLSFFTKSISRINTTDKVVFLTFDDGPSANSTNRILDTLKEYGVKVTFFCIGTQAKANSDILRRINAEGHLIGSHTMNHTWGYSFSSFKKTLSEIDSGNKAIEETIGKKIHLFRPPWGVTNPSIAKAVKELELNTIAWSIRSLDTTIHNKKKLLNRIISRLKPGSIILLHDRLDSTAELLPEIIAGIRDKGFTIEPLDIYLGKN